MNEFELRRTEQEIREVLTVSNLQWVLDEVDATIESGVHEEKILRRRAGRRESRDRRDFRAAAAEDFEVLERAQFNPEEYEASRKRGTLVIATRPMDVRERVGVLLDALERILIELPEIEHEVRKLLAAVPDDDEGTRKVVYRVDFESDENVQRHREGFTVTTDRVSREQRERLRLILRELRLEVRN